jgi:hypothetical protein
MFLVHKMPVTRNAAGGTWVDPERPRETFEHGADGSDPELVRLRQELPLNGETSPGR